MRTDFTLDNVAVRLPLADSSGHGKWQAKRGDWVAYVQEFDPKFPNQLGNASLVYGRVVGRVRYRGITGTAHTSLYVIALGTGLDFPLVRWVEPEAVRICTARMPEFAVKLIQADFSSLEGIRAVVDPWLAMARLSFGDKDKS